MSNLKLWESVQRTDPSFTKKGKKGAYTFTAIAPIYQFKEATNAFGIQGIAWGVKIGSEVFTEKEYGTTILLSYDATMFFTYDGEKGEIPIHATEKIAYQTQGANGYLKIDDEARKKVVTNAKTKGLSELGFNADVFMGQHDDYDYIKSITDEITLEQSEDKIEEASRQEEEHQEWVDSVKQTLSTAVTPNELKGVFTGAIRKAKLRKDDTAIRQFTDIKDKRKGELEK